MSLTIKGMLLIEEPTVKILKDELMTVAGWFILPSFVFALVLEYFGELKFLEVVKKLILVLVFIGSFYAFHTEAVNLSFKGSEEILRKVSPNNIFLRKWTETKVKTDGKANWSMLEKFAIPNINDLLGTAFFLMSKVFIWILKLVYTTVYHLTYIFAPLTAVLYFFPITKNSLAGTIQSSLWCIFMPIVLVSILAIVGNSIQVPAGNGEVSIVSIEHILWLFGVTLLLLMSPVLTLGILRGGGVAMSGSAIGAIMTNSAMKVLASAPIVAGGIKATSKKASSIGSKALLEPSVKDLIKKDMGNNPDKGKLKLLDKKGGLRNPFKGQKGIDERLAQIGMTKGEAMSLSRMSSANSISNQNGGSKVKMDNSKTPQEQETFKFDKSFWSKITPEHREGIRAKYGITGDKPTPNKLYRPVLRLGRTSIRNSLGESRIQSSERRPEISNVNQKTQLNKNPGRRNEVRNI